jgi:hypothetical protein
MRTTTGILCCLLFCGSLLTHAQSSSRTPAPPPAKHGSTKPAANSSKELEHNFFAILRSGDARKLLSYIPEDGVNLGHDAKPTPRAEIEKQLTNHRALYCQLFDSSCMQSMIKLDASAPACSDRELLTQSEKVRTASTETTRNGVRQAILAAEVHNQKCGGPILIDFIFNHHPNGWKLFSIP